MNVKRDALFIDLELSQAVRQIGLLRYGFGLRESLAELVTQSLSLSLLGNKAKEEGHDASEIFSPNTDLTQLTYDVGQQIVNGVVASLGKFKEQQSSHILDTAIVILQAERNLANLALYFDHIVQNEMRQDHERVTSHSSR